MKESKQIGNIKEIEAPLTIQHHTHGGPKTKSFQLTEIYWKSKSIDDTHIEINRDTKINCVLRLIIVHMNHGAHERN